MLDSSESIRNNNPIDGSYDNWNLLLQFVVNIVNHLNIGEDATRVGVVRFSDKGQNIFLLGDYYHKQYVVDTIARIGYIGGANTNTSGGLYIMRTEQFTVANGDRPAVQNIAIVVTDGSSTGNQELAILEAELARKQGIKVYSVGITNAVNEAELKAMASVPQELDQNYWVSTDFQALSNIVDTLVTEACLPPQRKIAFLL